jgi:hypothetical protein
VKRRGAKVTMGRVFSARYERSGRHTALCKAQGGRLRAPAGVREQCLLRHRRRSPRRQSHGRRQHRGGRWRVLMLQVFELFSLPNKFPEAHGACVAQAGAQEDSTMPSPRNFKQGTGSTRPEAQQKRLLDSRPAPLPPAIPLPQCHSALLLPGATAPAPSFKICAEAVALPHPRPRLLPHHRRSASKSPSCDTSLSKPLVVKDCPWSRDATKAFSRPA